MISAHCKYFVTIVITFIALHSEGQFHFNPAFKARNKDLCNQFEAFVKSKALDGASVGISIRPIHGESSYLEYQPRLNLIPASNLKLITSLNGFQNLGTEYRFQTRIYRTGAIKNGVLEGDLVVEGSGDPSIYSPENEKFNQNFFKQLVELLQRNNIRKIEGSLRSKKVNNSYSGIKQDWPWGDVANYYGAGIYPLNINENQFALFLEARQQGEPARIKKFDSLMDVQVKEEKVETDSPGTPDLAYLYWLPGSKEVRIEGTLPSKPDLQKVKGALQDPEKVWMQVAKKQLNAAGIEVREEAKANTATEFLGTLSSPPLKELAKEINLFSNNLYTESFAFALCKEGDKLDENGWTHLAKFANRFNCPQGYYFSDGSGLSLSNRISADGLCRALVWAAKQPFFKDFEATLPISGVSGTMRKFCGSPQAKGKIKAKSGTLTRTLCYSGYAETKAGPIVFSIMINSYNGPFKSMKNSLEKVMELLPTIK